MNLPLRLPPLLASNRWYSWPFQSRDQPSLNRTWIITKISALWQYKNLPVLSLSLALQMGRRYILKKLHSIKFGYPCVWNRTYQCSCVHDRLGWHTCRISAGSPHHSTDSCRFTQNYDFQKKKLEENEEVNWQKYFTWLTIMLRHGGAEVLINTCKVCERRRSESFSSHRPMEATFFYR